MWHKNGEKIPPLPSSLGYYNPTGIRVSVTWYLFIVPVKKIFQIKETWPNYGRTIKDHKHVKFLMKWRNQSLHSTVDFFFILKHCHRKFFKLLCTYCNIQLDVYFRFGDFPLCMRQNCMKMLCLLITWVHSQEEKNVVITE